MRLICRKCMGRALSLNDMDTVRCERCEYIGALESFLELRELKIASMAWRARPISDLFPLLSVRAINGVQYERDNRLLHNEKFARGEGGGYPPHPEYPLETVGDVVDVLADRGWWPAPNFGAKSVAEVKEAIAKLRNESANDDS